MVDIPEQALQAAIEAAGMEGWDHVEERMKAALTAAAPYMSGVNLGQLEPPQHSIGWLYHSDDAGTEFSENHPIESGECLDAKDIKPATAENLRNELLISWKTWAEDREELNRLRDALSSAREQALEEAAKKAECHSDDRARRYSMDWNDGYIDGCKGAAAAIRALKSQPAPQTGGRDE